jgi:flagellar biosynthesis GTPase FlhF
MRAQRASRLTSDSAYYLMHKIKKLPFIQTTIRNRWESTRMQPTPTASQNRPKNSATRLTVQHAPATLKNAPPPRLAGRLIGYQAHAATRRHDHGRPNLMTQPSLSESQRRIAERSDPGTVFLEGPAGVGKTTAGVARIRLNRTPRSGGFKSKSH